MTREVVVTGIGVVSPLGIGARTLFERWRTGVSGLESGEGACAEFDPGEWLSVKDQRRADRFTQLALVAADEAIADAGWNGELPYDPFRVGCVIGTAFGGLGTFEEGKETLLARGPKKVPPLAVPLMLPNAAPAAVSIRHQLRGNALGVVSACAAGAHAIGEATRMIRCGDLDAVVAGGSEAALTPLSRAGFAALDALSTLGISRPFDARRDGFVMGEGAGVLVLEDGERAAARGARVLAKLRGIGATSDAHHLTAPRDDGIGAAEAIRAALRDAGVEPEEVAYVNAHGTSTPLNDRVETLAIKAALGDHAADVAVSSTKSAIGHLLGAAGAVEAIATILALRYKTAPPTLGYEEPDDGLDLDYVPGQARSLAINGRPAVGLSNAFGFGGHNVVLCVEA